MQSKTLVVKNGSGIHARPASMLVKEAGKFSAEISLEFNGKKANAKSIMSVLSLGVGKDSEITVSANGDDENAALEGIINLIESGFGE